MTTDRNTCNHCALPYAGHFADLTARGLHADLGVPPIIFLSDGAWEVFRGRMLLSAMVLSRSENAFANSQVPDA